MLTTAVLGIGVAALAQTNSHAEAGMRSSRLNTVALRIAEQRVEQLSTIPIDRLAGCNGPELGCRENKNELSPELGNVGNFRCTQWVDEMGFHDPLALTAGQFRIDTIVLNHPDPRQQAGARVLYVNVCWLSRTGTVEQVQLQRMIVPEV